MPVIDRRSFIGSLGAAAALGAVPRPMKAFFTLGSPPQAPRIPRVALLAIDGFPTLDAAELDTEMLLAALGGFEVKRLDVAGLEQLTPEAFDVFLNPYGSAFPKDGWSQIHDFLAAGGSWVNLGGSPFAVPAGHDSVTWQPEVSQTAYHKALGITQSFAVDIAGLERYETHPSIAEATPSGGSLRAEAAWELYYRFTREKEYPDEDGSDGPREAVVTPLVSVFGDGEHPIAAPVVRIDRLLGPFAGGRWVLANLRGTLSPEAIRAFVEHAALGAHQLTAAPTFACYRDDETPTITVTLKTPGTRRHATVSCRLEAFDGANNLVASATIPLDRSEFTAAATYSLQTRSGEVLNPGLYRVEVWLESSDAAEDGTRATTGFWIYDAQLLVGGGRFTTDRHTLLRGGKPFVVTGTSYMATDVHRRFLLEPNPHVFDRDFAAMRRAGINMIRTGIWTGWKNYMTADGSPNEASLRALDAFLLTSRKHDIPVIFTFFAFLPEMWGGDNPYLDPHSVEAQKKFLSVIARRYREMDGVIWDLINEPSFCSPERLWTARPNYDRHELEAWHEWLRERFPAESDEELEATLSTKWRTLPGDAMSLPRPEEFGDRNIFEELRPLKAMDYRLFANEMFTRWAEEMVATLHAAGSPDQLVTVGQDEGGTYERPSPMFHGPVVDFTSNHTWWLNDDLLWDHVVTKTPGRPNLISETGVMFYEKIDGSAWRTEEMARNLLERKLVLATAVGGAGFIEWIWNTNPYMPLDNESAIGLLRPDGSKKPEFDSLMGVAAFVAEHMHDLGPREVEPALMIIPHSYMFSVRNRATEATQRCVRAMSYDCRVAMSGCGEYALDRLDYLPRLIVVPSPRVLTRDSAARLISLAEAGATILATGPVDSDEHFLPSPGMRRLGIDASLHPVAQQEHLEIDGATHDLSFRGDKLQRVEKAVVAGVSTARVYTIPTGNGTIIWSPLPVELAHQVEPTVALYRYALSQAGIEPVFRISDPDPGVLVYPTVFENAALFGVVSELGSQYDLRFTHKESGTEVELAMPAQRATLLLLNRRDGRVLGSYRP
jgi:hypothetical protein